LQAAARAERRPGRRRDDRDARHHFHRLAVAFDDEGMCDSRQLAYLFQVRLAYLAADGRALLEHRVVHAGYGLVDAEQRLSGDDRVIVDAADAAAEQPEVLAILELQ